MNKPLRRKKFSKPEGCIFCGNTPLTGEHIFANWMRQYLDPSATRTNHSVFKYRAHSDGTNELVEVGPGVADRAGDHRSRKLHIVCGPCNNGWMSRMQEEVKPILVPMLQGNWSRLSNDDQEKLGAWATMTAYVWEAAEPSLVTSTANERRRFMERKKPGYNWLVFVGRTPAKKNSGDQFNRRAIRQVEEPHIGALTVASPAQFLFAANHLGDTEQGPVLQSAVSDLLLAYGLVQVWPVFEQNVIAIPGPGRALSEDDIGQLQIGFRQTVHAVLNEGYLPSFSVPASSIKRSDELY